MRKLLAPTILVLLVGLTAAFPADLNVLDREANVTDPAKFEVNIQNSFDQEKRFRLKIDGFKESWWFYDDNTKTLGPGEEAAFEVTVNATSQTIQDRYNFTIRAVTLDNESESIQTFFIVNRTKDLRIESFTTDKTNYRPGEKINTHLIVENTDKKDIDNYNLTLRSESRSETLETPTLSTGTNTLTPTFNISSTGTETITAVLEHNNYRQETSFNVEISSIEKSEKTENKVAKRVETSHGILSLTKQTVAKNQKDSAAEVEISRTMPVFYMPFISTEPEPDQRTRENIYTTLVWTADLQPDEERAFNYTLYYWMPVTLLVVLIGGLVTLKRRIVRKSISKTGKKDDGKVKIYLDIENKSRKKMEDIEIHDFVPAMLDVKEEFDTMEPELEENEYGTRLIWKIDSIEPKESRVLTYQVESDMEVESEIILKGAEMLENMKKVDESGKVKATFPAKEST